MTVVYPRFDHTPAGGFDDLDDFSVNQNNFRIT